MSNATGMVNIKRGTVLSILEEKNCGVLENIHLARRLKTFPLSSFFTSQNSPGCRTLAKTALLKIIKSGGFCVL
jgi:hypothetical protein